MSAHDLYRRVPVAMWHRDLAGLSVRGIVLTMRLRTGPETTAMPGVVLAGRAGLAEALGWPAHQLTAAASELEGRALIRADWTARVIWIPSAVADIPPANPSIVVGWRTVWGQVPRCALREEIAAELRRSLTARGRAYIRAWESIDRTPSEAPSGTRCPPRSRPASRTQDLDLDLDRDRDGEGDRAEAPPPPATPEPDPDADAVLATFSRAYREARGVPYPGGRFDRQRLAEHPLAAEHRELLPDLAAVYLADRRPEYDRRGHDLGTLIEDLARHVPAAQTRRREREDRERRREEAEAETRRRGEQRALAARYPRAAALPLRRLAELAEGAPAGATEAERLAHVEARLVEAAS